MNIVFEVSELSEKQTEVVSGGGCPVLGGAALVGIGITAAGITLTFLDAAFGDLVG